MTAEVTTTGLATVHGVGVLLAFQHVGKNYFFKKTLRVVRSRSPKHTADARIQSVSEELFRDAG